MKRLVALIMIVLFALGLGVVGTASARQPHSAVFEATPAPEDLVDGALLYDNWFGALGTQPPEGDMPLWAGQSTNTRRGADTWRCVECHGWDYKGAQGAYASGSHATGFPGVLPQVSDMDLTDIVGRLKGSGEPLHDFSKYMDEAELTKLALFLKYGLINDDDYIDDVSLKVIGSDLGNGKNLFDGLCANCHGMDGTQIVFRTEGVPEYLGSVANRDPWRFLHRTRFGLAGVDMPVAATLGWTVEDGRDVLAYAQTLPVAVEATTPAPASSYENEETDIVGGPPPGLLGGLFTGLGVFAVIAVGVVGFLGTLVALIAVVVWALRKR